MKQGHYSLFPLAVLAMLAALTFWLDRATRMEDGGRNGKNRHDPDFIVDKVIGKRFGENGKLVNVVTMDRMTHYPDDETTDVVNPDITMLREGAPPTHIRSKRAFLSKDGEVADMRDDVFGWRDAVGDVPMTTFASSQLTVYKDQEIARTDVPVKFTRAQSVLTGVGMDMDNKLSLLHLRSQVKGTIQPRKP